MDIEQYNQIVFFTGAGMSAESGVPTYRGRGGIWNEYKWEEYACESAFMVNPKGVLDFHQLRRIEALKCNPHQGHDIITQLQNRHTNIHIVTQNIDGMHQRSDSKNVIELHGSIWRMRCDIDGLVIEDLAQGKYNKTHCDCGRWLRPDIIWFQDMLNEKTVRKATDVISKCDLFISIGTSAVVWPAAGYPKLAKSMGAFCIEINPESTDLSNIYDRTIRSKASEGLSEIFSN